MLAAIEREWGRGPRRLQGAGRGTDRCVLRHGAESLPGIHEALDLHRGTDLCRLKQHSGANSQELTLTHLLDRFEPHIFSAVMVERGKPAPDLFLYAARAMRAEPARVVVIEDSVPELKQRQPRPWP